MTSGTLTGAGLSLGAAAVWGGGDFAGGIATKRANVFRVVAGAHACGLLLMLLLVWITGEPLPPLRHYCGAQSPVLLGHSASRRCTRRLRSDAWVSSRRWRLSSRECCRCWPACTAKECPTAFSLLGFVLALISIWLVARPDGEIDTHRGLGLAVLAGAMFGLFLIAGKHAGHHGVFWPLVAARTVSTLLMLLIVASYSRR